MPSKPKAIITEKQCALDGCSVLFHGNWRQKYCSSACYTLQLRRRTALWQKSDRGRAHQREYRARPETKEKARGYALRYFQKPAARIRSLIAGAAKRAKRDGFECDRAGLIARLCSAPPTICMCCKEALDYSLGRHKQGGWATLRHSKSPSLDKLRKSDGYTVANTRVICNECNILKSEGDLLQFRRLYEYLRRELPLAVREASVLEIEKLDTGYNRVIQVLP